MASGRDPPLPSSCKSLDGNEDFSILNRRRAGDGGRRILVDFAFPEEFAGDGVYRVGIGSLIAEKYGVAGLTRTAVRSHGKRAPHTEVCLEGPVGAAGFRIHRVQFCVVARNEKLAAGERRLDARRRDAFEAKGPLHFNRGRSAAVRPPCVQR